MGRFSWKIAFSLVVYLTGGAWGAEYHVDPVIGSMANPGTAERPWSTLAAVISSGKQFLPGDRVWLRRGYHGNPRITGHNTGDVYIHAAPGHTPTIRALTLFNASHWNFKGLTISPAVVPAGHPDASSGSRGVNIDTATNENSHYNTIENCYLYATQNTSNWTSTQWANGLKAGFSVAGVGNKLKGNHLYNAGGILVNYHANETYIGHNTNENFASDGMHLRANNCLVEFNLIMNSYKVTGNHNDLFQGYCSGTIFRNNELRAYSDPNQPFLSDGISTPMGVSPVQGFGCYDGILKNWVIENNLVRVDHAIGIWMEGATSSIIRNNKVVRCGKNVWRTSMPPSIRLGTNMDGSGAASTKCTVTNNQAEAFYLTTAGNGGWSVGTVQDNSVSRTWAPPFDDQAPSIPSGVRAYHIPGYGLDLQWNPSTDNVKTVGYEVFNSNNIRVGRTRAGTHFLVIDPTGNGIYRVRAYDYNDNKSGFSAPVDKTADEIAPSIPTGLAASAQSTTAISLSWQPSTDNTAMGGYEVYRNGEKIAVTAGTGHVATGLSQSTTYSFTVRAFDLRGNVSAHSATASATTLAPDMIPPSIPGAAVAQTLSSSAIRVSWGASTDNQGVVSYRVLRDGGVAASVSSTSFDDTGLAAGITHAYAIVAVDGVGNTSAPGPETSASTRALPAPGALTTSVISQSSINLAWGAAPSADVTGYLVKRNGTLIATVAGLSHGDAGLAASTTYSYAVYARDVAGNLSEASSSSATTMAPPPVMICESFNYPAGPLVGMNGGTGWGGSWIVDSYYDNEATGKFAIHSSGLPVYAGLGSAGRSAIFLAGGDGSHFASANRNFQKALVDDGNTYWMALQLQVPSFNKGLSISLNGATPHFITIKPDSEGMSLQFLGGTYHSPGDKNTHLLVMKIKMSGDANAESASLYYDPKLNSDASTWTALRTGTFTIGSTGLVGLITNGPRAGNTAYHVKVDEFRLANTWQAAVGMNASPTPDP